MKDLCALVEIFKFKHERFILGCDSIEEMGLWNKEIYGEMDVFYSTDLASVILRLIAVDGTITARETAYLNDTFGFAYTLEELVEVYDNCKEDIDRSFDEAFENGISLMRAINEKLADAYKELLGLVCEIIIYSDGILSEAEIAEVQRLKALCDQ
ncbi:MAG: TerB family tellurite resistance protein [Clostridia bacterium]|nr:TerB family tellurite resistance protein [Clostridia bacterium]